MLELTKLEVPERKRTYHFPGGETFTISDVTHFLARPNGNHRLRTSDGSLYVVSPGWLYVRVEADGFSL